ncbi:MAG: aldo/keto reductase [Phycisphaerales bacterium]
MALPLRPLGNTGLLVSAIGLGTVKLGRRDGVKYPVPFELPSDEQALELLRTAHDLGVNLIDTAPAYGTSETRLGELLDRVAPRERWVLCSKAGETFENGSSTFDFTPAAITASVERSLRRLRTDYLDVVLLHSNGDDEEVVVRSGALEALRALKRRGLVRAVGASTKTPGGALLAVERGDVVMLTLNSAEQGDAPAAALAAERGVGVLVKKALVSGHAVDPGAALRGVLAVRGVSCVVVGTIDSGHLRANTMAAAF